MRCSQSQSPNHTYVLRRFSTSLAPRGNAACRGGRSREVLLQLDFVNSLKEVCFGKILEKNKIKLHATT